MESLNELSVHDLKDLHDAEQQIIKALPQDGRGHLDPGVHRPAAAFSDPVTMIESLQGR